MSNLNKLSQKLTKNDLKTDLFFLLITIRLKNSSNRRLHLCIFNLQTKTTQSEHFFFDCCGFRFQSIGYLAEYLLDTILLRHVDITENFPPDLKLDITEKSNIVTE